MPCGRPTSSRPAPWWVALQNIVELFDWAIEAQEFFNGPTWSVRPAAMVGVASKTRMDGAEVVDDTSPEQLSCEALRGACGTARATHQGWHAGTEGGVEAFDVGGVDQAKADLCGGDEFIGALSTAVSDATLDAGEVIATVLLDDLNDVQVGPEDVPRASHLTRTQLVCGRTCGWRWDKRQSHPQQTPPAAGHWRQHAPSAQRARSKTCCAGAIPRPK